jgi:hypothetical protein
VLIRWRLQTLLARHTALSISARSRLFVPGGARLEAVNPTDRAVHSAFSERAVSPDSTWAEQERKLPLPAEPNSTQGVSDGLAWHNECFVSPL